MIEKIDKTMTQNTKGIEILGILLTKNDFKSVERPNTNAPDIIRNKSTPKRKSAAIKSVKSHLNESIEYSFKTNELHVVYK